MKVVLLDNVKGIGRVGDVKDVNDGYARNFLFPRKLGRPATDGIVKAVATLKAQKLEAHALEHAQALALAETLRGQHIAIRGKANAKGTLFSGVPAELVAERVSTLAGVHIPAASVVAHDHLKHVGAHTVALKLAEGITTEVTVDIEPL